MRSRWFAAANFLAMAALAAPPALDFADFDDALMREMDDAIKDLDSNLGGQDSNASRANVVVLRDGLAWAEQYFVKKPEAPLGVGYVREGQQHLAATLAAIEARDFEAANGHLRGVVRSCKACHEAYKPPE